MPVLKLKKLYSIKFNDTNQRDELKSNHATCRPIMNSKAWIYTPKVSPYFSFSLISGAHAQKIFVPVEVEVVLPLWLSTILFTQLIKFFNNCL